MKKNIIALFMLLSACGGGGGDAAPSLQASQHVPGVALLSYSPRTAVVGQGGGAIQVNGSFNFIDAAGDVNEMTITVQDADTFQVLTSTHTPVSTNGLTAGTINCTVNTGTATARNYIFNIHVNDSAGNHSNPLSGNFSVR